MTGSLGVFFSCYNEVHAVEHSIYAVNAVYPGIPIYLVSDGGHDFSYLTDKYPNIRVSMESDTMSATFRVTDKNFTEPDHQIAIKRCASAVLDRLVRAIEYCKTDYMVMLDPDALVRGRLSIPEGAKLLGSRINKGFPQALKNVLGKVGGSKVIDFWGATPAIFHSETFLKANSFIIGNPAIFEELCMSFYALYAHDVLLPVIFALIGEEEVLNPEIVECNRNPKWMETTHPLVHQFKMFYPKNAVAVVTGIMGQDGRFITEILQKNEYRVVGVVRTEATEDEVAKFHKRYPSVDIVRMDLRSKQSVQQLFSLYNPVHIYNFAGVSNVFKPWDNPDETFAMNATIPQNIMEVILECGRPVRFFQASSSLIYGHNAGVVNECSPTRPMYPYGITKMYAQNLAAEYRRERKAFFCTGIFFNHESEFRGQQFFTKKIIAGIFEAIRSGKKLKLGNLDSFRDMSYAGDFMEAVFLMMTANRPDDYVIGSGKSIQMREFVEKAFSAVGLNWKDHVEFDESLSRTSDAAHTVADTTKIQKELGWKPRHTIDDIITKMIEHERNNDTTTN